MNREQKRTFIKKAKKKGVSEREAKAYAEVVGGGVGINLPTQEIAEGEKIKLNLDAIQKERITNR